MSFTDKLEKYLQDRIFPELEKGRPNWDKPHTEMVVKYLKEIIKYDNSLNLNFFVMLIAAYAHDWGYSGMFEHGKALSYDTMIDSKDMHMKIGAAKTSEMLKNKFFDFLTVNDKERVEHLVYVHDRLGEIKDIDEIVLVEADTLGGLDGNVHFGNLTNDENERYLNGVMKKRLPLFMHDHFKEIALAMVDESRERYNKPMSP